MTHLPASNSPRPCLLSGVTRRLVGLLTLSVTVTLSVVALTFFATFAAAQTAVVISPWPQFVSYTQDGVPNAFGCVFTYQVGSTSPLTTYSEYTGTYPNQNPVILSAGGTAEIWLLAGQAYTYKVMSAGGTNCSQGTTLYTVNGLGGGSTTLTSIITYSSTPLFPVSAQSQLFEITLTGNASASPLTFVGVTPPSVIFFQITQDSSGGHTFSWPANSVGGCPIGLAANQVTTQEFVYDGANATAVGPCVIGNGPAISSGPILATYYACLEGTAPSGISNEDIFFCNSSLHRWGMINNNGTADVVVGAATSDTFTNKTFDTAGAGNVFKINGTPITDITGTGKVVLQTNPTINNPTLTTPTLGVAKATSLACPTITSKTGAYLLTTSDCIVQASVASAGFTLTLPRAATGQLWTITRTDSTAANTLTLAGDSGNVNGAASITVPPQSTYTCHADGTNSWCTFSASPGSAQLIQATRLTGSAATFTYPTPYSATPACVCQGEGGSCNIATVSTTACVINTTVSTNDVIVTGNP